MKYEIRERRKGKQDIHTLGVMPSRSKEKKRKDQFLPLEINKNGNGKRLRVSRSPTRT